MENPNGETGLRIPNSEMQIRRIAQELMVDDNNIIQTLPDGTKMKQTKEIADKMAVFGADRLDLNMLLSYYIYRHYYVNPPSDNQNTQDSDELNKEQDPVDQLTYEDIAQNGSNYWIDSNWQYAPGVINRKFNTRLVLRRGTQATWVKTGTFAEYSVTTDDDLPLLSTNLPTHTFAKGSPRATYNWIFGQFKSDDDNAGFVRFYFNLKPTCHAAKQLAQAIKKSFDLYEIPFTFKFLAFSKDYALRADTSVLYLERKNLYAASYLIRDIYRFIIAAEPGDLLVNPKVSLFVKPLLPGLSFADDPENNDSFGTSRCRAIARLMIKASLESVAEDQRPQFIVDQLAKQGYKLSEFYKNQYCFFDYEKIFQIITAQDGEPLVKSERFKPGQDGYRKISVSLFDESEFFGLPGRKKYLSAAIKIAIRLCKEAIWYQQNQTWHCNWLTYSSRNLNEPKQIQGYNYRLLPSKGPAYFSSLGIGQYLELIYQYYDADIFAVTCSAIDELSPIPAFADFNKEWLDQDIDGAWNETFVNRNMSQQQREELADTIIERFLQQGRPIGNGFEDDEPGRKSLFCPNVRYGLAGMGYFFLFVYDPKLKLPDPEK